MTYMIEEYDHLVQSRERRRLSLSSSSAAVMPRSRPTCCELPTRCFLPYSLDYYAYSSDALSPPSGLLHHGWSVHHCAFSGTSDNLFLSHRTSFNPSVRVRTTSRKLCRKLHCAITVGHTHDEHETLLFSHPLTVGIRSERSVFESQYHIILL